MCRFITLIAPSGDQSALSAVMARHGREARPVANRSIAKALLANENQYLTTRNHCDCGTVLAQGAGPDIETELAKETTRLASKGWSKAKIERAIADQRKAMSKQDDGRHIDSIPMWADVLRDVSTSLKFQHAGLLVHEYSGDVADEVFDVARRDAAAQLSEGLASMRQDEVLIFSRDRAL
jgi:hypothetical protein